MGPISALLRCAIGRLPAGLLPAWIALCVALTLRANAATQQFTLQPGWNAIHLEVTPETAPTPSTGLWVATATLSAVSEQVGYKRAGSMPMANERPRARVQKMASLVIS